MKIDELDEFQGLTGDMVTTWLFAHDWQRMSAQDLPRSECWVRKGGSGGTVWIGVDCSAEKTLLKLAAWMECSVQSLLREINPRMRKGMPSGAAIAAHEACGKHWLAKSTQNGGVLRVVILSLSDAAGKVLALDKVQRLERSDVPTSWSFWPCDEHGSKVRWPTDSEGKML